MAYIRIFTPRARRQTHDGGVDCDPARFAGQIPMIGDTILNPGVLQVHDRRFPKLTNLDRGRARL